MSADITDLLRECADATPAYFRGVRAAGLMRDAADEIDRLRGLLLRAMQHVPLSELYAEIDHACTPLYDMGDAPTPMGGSSHE
jgi:hypothetical protein